MEYEISKRCHRSSWPTIDIFKIDCEGCEWETYQTWNNISNIPQILLEVHKITNAKNLLLSMKEQGYVTFHKEPNIKWAGGDCVEYAFLRLHKDFFL